MKPLKVDAAKQTIEGESGYWINDPNNPGCPKVGPYATKKEATEAKQGLDRFYKTEALRDD